MFYLLQIHKFIFSWFSRLFQTRTCSTVAAQQPRYNVCTWTILIQRNEHASNQIDKPFWEAYMKACIGRILTVAIRLPLPSKEGNHCLVNKAIYQSLVHKATFVRLGNHLLSLLYFSLLQAWQTVQGGRYWATGPRPSRTQELLLLHESLSPRARSPR